MNMCETSVAFLEGNDDKERNVMKMPLLLSWLFLGSALFFSGCATSQPPHGDHCSTPQPQTPMSLIEATANLAANGASRLPADYIWATLKDRSQDPEVNAAFEQTLAETNCESKRTLLRALELKFIHDSMISGLDVLGPELSKHFREFAWQENDFPGGAEGPNEQFADVMVDALDLVRPERRANSTRDAVVLRPEATEAARDYITNQWVIVPGQERWKLNRHALDSFTRPR